MKIALRLVSLAVAVAILRRMLGKRSTQPGDELPPPDAVDDARAAAETRRDVFDRSYAEVLAALKHQDDKLNRTLTAIAFLTAAGVALFTRTTDAAARFDESGTSIAAYFFIVFLGATALALTLALAAIGPSTRYSIKRSRADGDAGDRSLIYYASIVSDDGWPRYFNDRPDDLVQHLASNLHDEAQNISKRTNYKVVRSRESGAFVHLAILALVLLGVFSIDAFSRSTQWIVGSVILLLLLLGPFYDLLLMHLYRFTEGPPSWDAYACLAITVAATGILLLRAPSLEQHWPAMTYGLIAFVISRLALAYKQPLPVLLLAGAALGGVVMIAAVEL